MKCSFCGIENNIKPKFPHTPDFTFDLPFEEKILFQSDNFFIKPDLAPITEYHFLLSPKNHFKSCRAISNKYQKEFERLKERIVRYYNQKLDMFCLFFEHGMSINNCDNSCIEHAHLHSIPLSRNKIKDLQTFINDNLPPEDFIPKTDSDYLFLSFQDNTYYWSSIDKEPQQLRKLISKFLGVTNRSQWQFCLSDEEQLRISIAQLKSSFKISTL
jgi:diadenosine tetraphosphate (Ap4A) HIT family hydrolase